VGLRGENQVSVEKMRSISKYKRGRKLVVESRKECKKKKRSRSKEPGKKQFHRGGCHPAGESIVTFARKLFSGGDEGPGGA